MQKGKVIILPKILDSLDELAIILYEKEYFGFWETSSNYFKELLKEIRTKLPLSPKKPAPKHFTDRYGKGLYYAVFTKNKRTQWYAFFRIYEVDGETYYQVRHIENNHTAALYF